MDRLPEFFFGCIPTLRVSRSSTALDNFPRERQHVPVLPEISFRCVLGPDFPGDDCAEVVAPQASVTSSPVFDWAARSYGYAPNVLHGCNPQLGPVEILDPFAAKAYRRSG